MSQVPLAKPFKFQIIHQQAKQFLNSYLPNKGHFSEMPLTWLRVKIAFYIYT